MNLRIVKTFDSTLVYLLFLQRVLIKTLVSSVEISILNLTEEENMNQISRFVIWICARFNREQIELIVKELSNILKSKQNFPTKPKDAFKEQHPNYREFTVDPTPPRTEPAKKKTKI